MEQNTGNNTGRNLKKVKEIRYPFSRQLIFALVMENEELCKELLERIFEGRHIKELKYYYKVRGYKTINGVKYYTKWSLKAWRKLDA